MKNFIKYVILLSLSIGILGNFLLNTLYLRPLLMANTGNYQKYSSQIEGDFQTIENYPIWLRPSYQKNAHQLLMKNIDMDGVDLIINKNTEMVQWLFEKHRYWGRSGQELEEFMDDAKIDLIDVTWMRELLNYDHWNFSKGPKIMAKLKSLGQLNSFKRNLLFDHLPRPNFNQLKEFGLVYLFQKFKKGNFAEGKKIYEHVLSLIYSANSLVSNIVAIQGRKNLCVVKKLLQTENCSAKELRSLNALERVSWAWMGIYEYSMLHSLSTKFSVNIDYKFGVCGASFSKILGLNAYYDYLGFSWPLEMNLDEEFVREKQEFKKLTDHCHNSELMVFKSVVSYSDVPWKESSVKQKNTGLTEKTFYHGKIPFLRKYVGTSLINREKPNWFRHYEKKK